MNVLVALDVGLTRTSFAFRDCEILYFQLSLLLLPVFQSVVLFELCQEVDNTVSLGFDFRKGNSFCLSERFLLLTEPLLAFEQLSDLGLLHLHCDISINVVLNVSVQALVRPVLRLRVNLVEDRSQGIRFWQGVRHVLRKWQIDQICVLC